jgi:capsular exopolysaccharide synthesis family protein
LSIRSSSPWEAAALVNTWEQSYQEYSQSDTRGEIIKTKLFLEKKLEEFDAKLRESQRALVEFKKREKVVALSDEIQQLVEQSASYQAEYNRTRADLQAVEEELAYSRSLLEATHKNLLNEIDYLSTPGIKEIQRQIGEKEAQKAEIEARMIGANIQFKDMPQYKALADGIEGLKKKLTKEMKKLVNVDISELNAIDRSDALLDKIFTLESDQKGLKARQAKQEAILKEYTSQLESLPDKSLRLADLELNVQVNNNTYLTLRENYENIKIREAGQMDIVTVVDLAEAPRNPVMPKKGRNLFLGFFFGIILGIGLAYSRDYFQDAVRTSQDLEPFQIRVLGSVIQYSPKNKKLQMGRRKSEEVTRAKAIYPYLLTHRHNHSSIAEAYRSIRTALYFADPEKPWKTLLVTSCGPSEGKSTTAANLAISIAQKGVKTLLIDADLRRPVMDVLFTGSHRKVGLSNVLGGEVNWQETIRETTVKGLSVMGAGIGVKNASELISSNALPKFLRSIRNEFGAIIFDSAPILPVTDTAVLSSLMDGVICVVRANQTSRMNVQRMLRLLSDVRARVFGVVLTGVKQNDPYGYQEYYSAYFENTNNETVAKS